MSRRATSHAQGANRLHRTVPCLRLPRRQARLCSEGRRDSVDRVGLAMAASQLAVRAIDLHDGHAVGVQEARESRSVAAGPFDADAFDRTESPKPDEQRAVAGRSRRERPYSELSATLVERGDPCWSRCVSAPAVTRVVGSAMVVIVIPSSEQPAEGWPHLPGRRTGQGRASQTGSYEVTFARTVRAGRCSGSVDTSKLRQPKRQSDSRVRPSPRTHTALEPPDTERRMHGRHIIPVRSETTATLVTSRA